MDISSAKSEQLSNPQSELLVKKVVKTKVQDAILTSFTLLTALLRKPVWAGATP